MPENDISSSHGSGSVSINGRLPDYSEFRHIRYRGQIGNLSFGSPPWSQVLEAMRAERQNVGSVASPDNDNIPAGFTYFGQFLAHDITAGREFGLGIPGLQLLSIYGGGPGLSPYFYVHYPDDLYVQDPNARVLAYDKFRHAKFMIGDRLAPRRRPQFNQTPMDVPRTGDSLAMMADTRNDQNFILSQLHVAFLHFHNAVADYLNFLNPNLKGVPLFNQTRKVVTWCYQRIVVEEYLKMLVYEPVLIDRLKEAGQNFSLFKAEMPPRLMPEFAMAAFRIGHSQVQEVYLISGSRTNNPVRRSIFLTGDARQQSSNGSWISRDLRGFMRHEDLKIDWSLFFDFPGKPLAQPSSAIDQHIPYPLYGLIFKATPDQILPKTNLERSQLLPPGHAMAEPLYEEVNRYDKKNNIPDQTLLMDSEVQKALRTSGLKAEELPLWLYILLEASIKQGGQRLGILGSHIVAEQIMWVLRHDKNSWLFADKDYLESLKTQSQNLVDIQNFGISDLLQFPQKVAEKMQAANKRTIRRRTSQPA